MSLVDARRTLFTVSANDSVGTATGWIPLDVLQAPFEVGFGVRTNGGSAWRIQHTFDNVFDTSITPLAHDHSVVSATQASAVDGNYVIPVRAVRMVLASAAVSTRVCARLTLIQGG